ncbi:hypothetical protein [Streptomyces capparidis]
MPDHDHAIPDAVDTAAVLALADGWHRRTTRFLGAPEAGGHLIKLYAIEAPGRAVTPAAEEAALARAADQLRLERSAGSLGLGCVIVHAGGDGDYLLVHTWVEAYMSRLAVFTGPADRPELLRPGAAGLAPCVWEAEVLSHERDAYLRRVLAGGGTVEERLAAWRADVLPTAQGRP